MYSSNLLYQRQIASDRQQLRLRRAGASRLRREIQHSSPDRQATRHGRLLEEEVDRGHQT